MDGAGVYRSNDGGTHWSVLNSGLPAPFSVREIAASAAGEVLCCPVGDGVYQLNSGNGQWSAINSGLVSTNGVALAFGNGYTLVGTRGGGVCKRVGNGSWNAANTGLTNLFLNDVVVLADGRCYACTDAGLFVSTNAAASWGPVPGPFSSGHVNTLVDTGTALLLGNGEGIFRSIDGGTQWDSATSGFGGTAGRVFAADASGHVFVGAVDTGVSRSSDDGATWAPSNTGLAAHAVYRLLVNENGTIFAGTQGHGLYRSTDGGANWDAPMLMGRTIFALAQSPWGEVFAGNYTITGGVSDGHAYRSSDDGQSWTALDNGLHAAMVSGFVFPGGPQVMCSVAWNAGSVLHSAVRGNAWSAVGPASNEPAYFLGRSPAGDLYFGSEGEGVWRLGAGDPTWVNKGFEDSQQFTVAFNSLGYIYFGNDGRIRGVYRSIDGGASFQPLDSFPSLFGNAILVLPNDDIYVGTQDVGIQYSSDHGASWQPMNTGIPTAVCYALALGPDGYLYAGTAGHGVFRSTQQIVLPGDADDDGQVDLADHAAFATCLTGPSIPYLQGCAAADIGRDGDVDLADFAAFQRAGW
jgi:photosystem II stability/assembly factor-like uncharacterized protein